MPDQITIHDYQVPDVTFEEADTIARNVFGDSMISPDFADKIRLILEDDRERVADLQDPWVEVPEGATIPEGVMIRRVLLLTERASEWIAFEQVVAEGAPLFVRKSDLLRVAPVKTRRERIIEEMAAKVGMKWGNASDPAARELAEAYAEAYESAAKVVDSGE